MYLMMCIFFVHRLWFVDAIADRVSRSQRPRYTAHLSSAVNFWIFLHAFSSCSSDVA